MIEIEIREATPKDAQQLIEFTWKIGGESDNLSFGAEGLNITIEQEENFLEAVHAREKSILLCGWEQNRLVATAGLQGMDGRMSHRSELSITVLKEEWNKGIGSMLMERIIEFAKKEQIELINLQVRSDNMAAIHLYQKYGFQKGGIIPAFFKIGSEYIDFDLMTLDLR